MNNKDENYHKQLCKTKQVKSNLFLLGGVQQVDPKEKGIQPT